MKTFVHVTFDLRGARPRSYTEVRRGLAKLRLLRDVRASSGKNVRLPHNTFVGKYRPTSGVSGFADRLKADIKSVFKQCGVHGRAFIFATGDGGWAWRKAVR